VLQTTAQVLKWLILAVLLRDTPLKGGNLLRIDLAGETKTVQRATHWLSSSPFSRRTDC